MATPEPESLLTRTIDDIKAELSQLEEEAARLTDGLAKVDTLKQLVWARLRNADLRQKFASAVADVKRLAGEPVPTVATLTAPIAVEAPPAEGSGST